MKGTKTIQHSERFTVKQRQAEMYWQKRLHHAPTRKQDKQRHEQQQKPTHKAQTINCNDEKAGNDITQKAANKRSKKD